MKAIIAMIAACVGAPAMANERLPAASTYAGNPGRRDAPSTWEESGSVARDAGASASITNFAPLDNRRDDLSIPRHGIRLAASTDPIHISQAQETHTAGAPGAGPHKVIIYDGHITSKPSNKLQVKPAGGGTTGSRPHKFIIYDAHITSKPSNKLQVNPAGGAAPHSASDDASKSGTPK